MTTPMRKKLIAALPDETLVVKVWLEAINGNLDLAFEAVRASGEHYQAALHFVRVRAYRQMAEAYCGLWEVEDVYNRLVEVDASHWISDMRAKDIRGGHDWRLHHYMIYLEDAGCFEVVADSWSWLDL